MNNKNYTYRKLKLENLESNKFYTFYRKDGIKFKGIFDSIIGVTLLIRDYITETEMDKSAIRSMPKDWISYAESEEFTIKVNNFLV
jgi:hypothetical protein